MVCWGWEMDLKRKSKETGLYSSKETYFAVVILEDPGPGAEKVRCMCLAETSGALARTRSDSRSTHARALGSPRR